MKVLDLHCDTLTEIKDSQSFLNNNLQIDLNKLKKGDYLLQNFAIFTMLNENNDHLGYVRKHIDLFYEILDKYSNDIAIVKTYDDIIKNKNNGKISAMLTLEEGSIIGDNLNILDELYLKGVRMIALSWNFENGYSYPNVLYNNEGYNEYSMQGLTLKGKEYIKKMDELGMIIDVSHMSDGCFYDVCKIVSKPIVASHSNCRSLCNHGRNLTDDMIKMIARKKGVIGINYYHKFVNKDKEITLVKDLVKHIDYIKNLVGIDYIALGSDFDGIDDKVEIKDASYIMKLEEELRRQNYSLEEIEKIFYKNALRVYKEVLK